MDQLTLVIGQQKKSSWSLRPWFLLKHTGIPFATRKLWLDTPEFKSNIAPYGAADKVPLLLHDGLVLWESLAICEYIAELYPEKKLWPSERRARALARAVANEMHAGFAALRHECTFNCLEQTPLKSPSPACAQDISRLTQLWTRLRRESRHQGPFLFGDFSVADAMFAPVAGRFWTYNLSADTQEANDYVQCLLQTPAYKTWVEEAQKELRV